MTHRRKDDANSDGPPLVDELNELIEKERTLLNLKLLAQKNETDSWKTKYDQLLDKVGTGSYDNLALSAGQTLESAAEVEMEGSHVSEVTFYDVQQILMKRIASWILDLSGVVMDKMLFAKLGKEVFGPRSSFDAINTLNVSGCSITDEFAPPLLSIMRTSRLQAIDLSHNELSDMFFLQMLETLKNVRRTPQYVLLEGNTPLSASAKHFEAILDALTEHTWGLTVSLMDFTDLALAVPHKSSKAARREPNFDYKETVKQPMLVYEFLKAFNQKLDPAASRAVGAAKKVAAASKAILLGRQNGLHRMTAFGLKYCHISKKSVGLLEATLKHVASSLTDLDLSFAYIGYPGAEMLRNVLSAGGCQLIRLGLIGNAMGDAGIATMSKSLQAHPTLTYIDLRSNDISNAGLTALASPLVGNCVLSLLDLRGNAVGQEAALALARQLSDAGSHLHVRWDVLDVAHHSRTDRLTAEPIYSFPHQVKTVGAVGKATKLYSIDLTTVHLNHPERYGLPLALEWKWRPTPIGSFSTAGALLEHGNHGDHAQQRAAEGASEAKDSTLNTTKSARASQSKSKAGGKGPSAVADTDDNSHYFRVGSSYSVMWEVRVVYNHQELFVQRQAIGGSSAVTRKVLERFPAWVSSSLILQDLPLKATIEVLVTCVDTNVDASDAFAQRARTKHFVGFQGVDLHLSPVPFGDFYRVGGDDPSFSPETNSLLGRCDDLVTRALQQQHPALRNMLILRRLRCASQGKGLSNTLLSWKAKLTSTSSGFKSAAATSKRPPGSDEMPPNHLTLGYSWAVHVLSAEGGQRVAAEGVCVGGLDGEAAGSGAGAAEDSKLRAWIWRDCAAAIFDLREDDWVLLVGRPISQQPNYPAAALASCAIAVKDCELSVTLADPAKGQQQAAQHGEGDLHHGEEQHHAPPTIEAAGVVCDGAGSLLFAWHDDPSLQLPF